MPFNERKDTDGILSALRSALLNVHRDRWPAPAFAQNRSDTEANATRRLRSVDSPRVCGARPFRLGPPEPFQARPSAKRTGRCHRAAGRPARPRATGTPRPSGPGYRIPSNRGEGLTRVPRGLVAAPVPQAG